MGRHPKFSGEALAELLKLIVLGVKYSTIAGKYGVTPQTIGYIARKAGIHRFGIKQRTPWRAEQVLSLYKLGYKQTAIAKKLKISRQAVFAYLRDERGKHV